MKSLVIKIAFTATLICFSLSISWAQTEPRLVLPIGHTAGIKSAVFSPDGKYALTASWDNTARIYEVSSGKELHVLTGHTDKVESAVFSLDGKYALTASWDQTARIYEVSSGKEMQVLSGHSSVIWSAVFSPDGKYALTASNDSTARIYEVSSGKEFHVLTGHTEFVRSAVFSPDGKYVLTASDDNTARIYEVSSGKELHVLSGHTRWVHSAVFSRDGKYALTASADSTARIYEVSSGNELHVLHGHKDQVISAVFSPDGKYTLTASVDHTARIYEVSSGKELQVLLGHNELVKSVVFSPDGKYILSVSFSGVVRICEVFSGVELYELSLGFGQADFGVFSPDGKIVLIVNGRELRICEVGDSKVQTKIGGHTEEVWFATFSPDESNLITVGVNTYNTWDVLSGSTIVDRNLDCIISRSYSLSPNGKMIMYGCVDGEVSADIYEVSTGKRLQALKGHTGWIKCAVFSPNSKLVLTASEDSTARIYEVATGNCVQILEGHTRGLISADFSPDGTLALTTSEDSTARIFEVATGSLLHVLRGHSDVVRNAGFSPNGELVLTAGSDHQARIYEVATGNCLQVLQGHSSFVRYAVFSPDGTLALTTNDDRTARIYEVATGNELQVLKSNAEWAYPAFFSPDGKLVLTSCEDGRALIFKVSTGEVLSNIFGGRIFLQHPLYGPKGKYLITTSSDHKTILWDAATGKPLYTRLQLKDNDWLVYDEHYRFDGTPGAIEKLYFTCGLEVIELGQMKDALYVPGLVSKILNGEDINYKKLSDLEICGALPLIEKIKEANEGWEFSIEKRRWDITRLEIKVDGKTVKTILPDQLKFVNGKAIVRITRLEMRPFLIVGEANSISLVAITENDHQEFISRGVELELEAEGDKQAPNFYMLMIGVNDYKDDALDLRFPVQDARAFGSALESSARKLLGDNKVFVYNVQSKTENNTVYTTPERVGIMKALEEIGKKAKTNDVLFIFFAGHGVMQGADNTFTFLTADASKLNPVGVSTQDLKLWLSPEGPFHMMPNKTVLVYDACNSGQAAKEIIADLAMARDDNATERQRQIEDLGDKQGVFILAASAPNQSAYELPHLGQGMLTYSLLTTLKNNPGVLDEDKNGKGFLNLQKWFLETEREQSRLMQSLGLNQDAQPYGTANIRIGIVDDEVRSGIHLMAEKPLVFCSSARDDSEEDPLELKQSVNAFLETATSRGTSAKLGYIKAETSQANIVKLVYNTSGDKVQCRILIFKNKIKINELNIITTVEKAAEEVVKAVEGVVK